MSQWEHATLVVEQGQIELIAGGGVTTVDPEAGSLRRAMLVLNDLTADGWEVIGSTPSRLADGAMLSTYLMRRLIESGDPQIH